MATQQDKTEIAMGKPQLRSLKQKAVEDIENGMTIIAENVDSNTENNNIQTTKNIQGQTGTKESSKIISSEQKRLKEMSLRSSEGRKRKMDDKKQEDHSCSGRKITKAAIAYNFKMATQQDKTEIVIGKPQLRSLQRKAVEDIENGMTVIAENVDSNSENNNIQTTKTIQGQTGTKESSMIISSEQKRLDGMTLRSSEGRKRKMDEKKQEDHSCSGRKITKVAIAYLDGMTLRSSEGRKRKMDEKKQEDHSCSGRKITKAAIAYNFKMATQQDKTEIAMGKPQLRSLKQKAVEDIENGMTIIAENVDSNSENNNIKTTKTIQWQTGTKESSMIISSEQKRLNGMVLRSSERIKRKIDDKKQEDHSSSEKKETKAGTVYGDGSSASTSIPTQTKDGDEHKIAVSGFGSYCLCTPDEETAADEREQLNKVEEEGNQPADIPEPWIEPIITNNGNALKHDLPNQSQLDNLVKQFGRKSKLVFEICDKISCSIKTRDRRIISVWAAYPADKTDQEQISFVVVVKDDIPLDKMKDYRFFIRKQGQVNDEGKEVLNSKKFDKYLSDMPVNEIQNIRESINKNNIKLMEQHKYLTIISGSPIRSKGYGFSHTIKREPCILLYVFVKGYIPINEERFQTKYDGVAVDVREGLFTFNAAKKYQKTLKHGCQIERCLSGTLGGFINHREFGTCGLTSGHVLLKPEEFNNFGPKKTVQNWNNHTDNAVYQPSIKYGRSCGMLVRAIHDKGGGGKSGMNIAVFQVEKRYPENGEFPRLTDGSRPEMRYSDGSRSEMRFDSGQTVSDTRLGFGKVYKFGAATELTIGNVLCNAPIMSVKYLPENDFDIGGKYVYRLHNLFEVRTATVSANRQILKFATFGDSGALVFCEGEAGRLTCVGMIEGSTTADTCAVMPIAPILEQLQITGMKSFERNKLEEKINKGFKNMKTEFRSMKKGSKKMERKLQGIDARLKQLIKTIKSIKSNPSG